MKIVISNFAFSILICAVCAAPQYPEINDQFEANITEPEPKPIEVHIEKVDEVEKVEDLDQTTTTDEINPAVENNKEIARHDSIITKLYKTITDPIVKFIKLPKINIVMTNIGTCIVNGAMEIISYYFPAPLIPLIASAAGLVIPFEPVVLLREKMPVTSYRRAFKTAVKGFLGTFDRYKYEEEDPYMTRRFNRRFMGDSKEKKIETDD